jgi:thiol-disulfide isomerase/thioredoxin
MDRAQILQFTKFAVLAGAAGALIYTFTGSHDERPTRMTSPSERKAMPQIELSDLKGAPWRLSDHRGEIVLVNFWATWCTPCRMETPDLVRVAQQYGSRGVAFVGVSMDDQPKSAAPAFVSHYRIPYPVLVPDSGFTLGNAIENLPTTLLVDRNGRLAKAYTGAVTADRLRSDLDHLLAETERRT